MLSIIFASRVQNNPDSNIDRFIESLLSTISVSQRNEVELLIKYDDDDELRPTDGFFSKYPISVQTVNYSRCTGRSHLHHFCEYLFTLKSKQSKYIFCTADDFIFLRDGWLDDVFSCTKKYSIINSGECPHQAPPYFSKPRPSIESINYYDMYAWRCCFGNCCPIFSVPLIETVQNFGWNSSTDAWAYLLSMMCYQDFNINIMYYLTNFYKRTVNNGNLTQSRDEVMNRGADDSYNLMQQTGSKNCQNLYWFDLVYNQAKNVYLRIKDENILSEYLENN